MRDWSKFFKCGDVVCNAGSHTYAVFSGWEDDNFLTFNAGYVWVNDISNKFDRNVTFPTNTFTKCPELADTVIKKIEEYYGGKINPDTLCMSTFFKDGDIVDITTLDGLTTTAIVKAMDDTTVSLYVDFCKQVSTLDYNEVLSHKNLFLERATSEHIRELHDALKRNGKCWDSENRQIKITTFAPSSTFMPFDKVLVRDADEEKWQPAIFSYFNDGVAGGYFYMVINNMNYRQCIPYEGNEHLLGTTYSCEEKGYTE